MEALRRFATENLNRTRLEILNNLWEVWWCVSGSNLSIVALPPVSVHADPFSYVFVKRDPAPRLFYRTGS